MSQLAFDNKIIHDKIADGSYTVRTEIDVGYGT